MANLPCRRHWKTSRKYRDHTLILETTFENEAGCVRLIDFMPIREHNSNRNPISSASSKASAATSNLTMALGLRFDYGRTVPWVHTRHAIDQGIRAVAGPASPSSTPPFPVHGENLHTVAEFTVSKGEQAWFTLT